MSDLVAAARPFGCGLVQSFLMQRKTFPSERRALGWLAREQARLGEQCVGGRWARLPGEPEFYEAVVLVRHTVGNERRVVWIPCEAWEEYGLERGKTYYAGGQHE